MKKIKVEHSIGYIICHDITVFDIIQPYILPGKDINKTHLASLGYGGV